MIYTSDQMERAAIELSGILVPDIDRDKRLGFCRKIIHEVVTSEGPYLRYGRFHHQAIECLKKVVEE